MKSRLERFREFFAAPTLQKKLTFLLVLAHVCLLSLHLSGWSTSRAGASQGNKRLVAQKETLKDLPQKDPVEISDLQIKGKQIKVGEMFEEDGEWLRNLGFKLKNKGGKAITYVVLNFDFPETQDTGNMMTYSLYLGQQPDYQITLANPPIHLKPNQSIDVSLAPKYEELRRFIESRQPPMGRISKVTIWLDQAMFEDGTVYFAGSLYKRNPDPASPRKWVPATD